MDRPGRRFAHGLCAGLCLALAPLFACSPAAPPGPPRGLVLVVIDTLRADHLGIHGYDRPTSPEVDAFAADSIRFTQALAPSPWTLPSLATLMTSLYPAVHGASQRSPVGGMKWLFEPDTFKPTTALHPSRTRLAELLQSEGFATLGIIQGSYPSAVFGFAQGFDRYEENATPGFRFDVEAALRWLDEESPERFFLYLHVKEVHSPYTIEDIQMIIGKQMPGATPEYLDEGVEVERKRMAAIDFDPGYRGKVDGSLRNLKRLKKAPNKASPRDIEHLVALYDRGIKYMDGYFGALLEGLRERGLYDETVIVFTSDHGEEFREHGRFEHGYSYYEEMLHVPLIVRVPGEPAGLEIGEPVGLADVMPTVLEVLGVEATYPTQGRSLVPLWSGGGVEPRPFFGEASQEPGSVAIRDGGYKFVRHAKRADELYALASDPRETRNRCRAEPELCQKYGARLDEWVRAQQEFAAALELPEDAEVDEELMERLRSMGYVD